MAHVFCIKRSNFADDKGSMQEFIGYEKMPDSIRKLGLDLQDTRLLDSVEWVVTEKVHGANFSFIFTGDELRYAKRKAYLRWADDFFGFQLAAERLDGAVMRLFERIRRDHPFHTAVVYGELFGGNYPHRDVPADPRVQAIQTGIFYSPTVEYYAFDIAILPTEAEESRYYLDYAQAVAYFEACGIPYARPLFIGKLNEALFFDTRFNSKIPAWLGLPDIGTNLVEGIVVKPYRNIVVNSSKGLLRPIFKIKNKEFSEEQFHEAQNWSYFHTGTSATERLLFLVPELRRYITVQRLQNTISKIGHLTKADAGRFQEIRAAFIADVFESFWEANPELAGDFSEDDLVWLHARVEAEVDRCMKDNV
jgi:Rnl2 family RNA ligase